MSALTFSLKSIPIFKLNCGLLTPQNLSGLSHSEIEKLKLGPHKSSPSVVDYFNITGDDTTHIVIKNTAVLEPMNHSRPANITSIRVNSTIKCPKTHSPAKNPFFNEWKS